MEKEYKKIVLELLLLIARKLLMQTGSTEGQELLIKKAYIFRDKFNE